MPRKRTERTPEIASEVARRLASGESQNTIARSLGIAQSTVYRIKQDVGQVSAGARP